MTLCNIDNHQHTCSESISFVFRLTENSLVCENEAIRYIHVTHDNTSLIIQQTLQTVLVQSVNILHTVTLNS